ncbi:MAG: hypothetical protein P4L03_07575 [Terracidiphilus sp.]|nr:hypothetical protein [Terracidiphilus sp.]
MKTSDERMAELLRQSVGKMDEDAEAERDLWLALLKRMDEHVRTPWFDWALLGGIALAVLLFPAIFPVVLYCL